MKKLTIDAWPVTATIHWMDNFQKSFQYRSMLCRNYSSIVNRLDTLVTPRTKSAMNQSEQRENSSNGGIAAPGAISNHDGRYHSDITTTAELHDNGEPKELPKRARTWSFASSEDMETTKKIKVENDDEKIGESPTHRPRDAVYAVSIGTEMLFSNKEIG